MEPELPAGVQIFRDPCFRLFNEATTISRFFRYHLR